MKFHGRGEMVLRIISVYKLGIIPRRPQAA
jgi:hypothetical protein